MFIDDQVILPRQEKLHNLSNIAMILVPFCKMQSHWKQLYYSLIYAAILLIGFLNDAPIRPIRLFPNKTLVRKRRRQKAPSCFKIKLLRVIFYL